MTKSKNDDIDGRLRVRRPGELWVYFLRAPEAGLIKIGITTEPTIRIRTLQLTSPMRLQLVGLRAAKSPLEERDLHARFDHYRFHGEWFGYNNEIDAEARTDSLTECNVMWRRCTKGLTAVWGSTRSSPILQPRSPHAERKKPRRAA